MTTTEEIRKRLEEHKDNLRAQVAALCEIVLEQDRMISALANTSKAHGRELTELRGLPPDWHANNVGKDA